VLLKIYMYLITYTVVYSYQNWQILSLERTVFAGIESVKDEVYITNTKRE